MNPLIAFGLWRWVEDNRGAFEPPVGNKVIWEDSQFTAMIIRGPNARRDFHVDPSDEIFYMLRGDMVLETMRDGRREEHVIREGELFLVPALTPHAPHRPADTWGLVVEIKRAAHQTESLHWYCDRCDALLHEMTMHVADIERELRAAIEGFDASPALRTCRSCGHVQPEKPPAPQPPGAIRGAASGLPPASAPPPPPAATPSRSTGVPPATAPPPAPGATQGTSSR